MIYREGSFKDLATCRLNGFRYAKIHSYASYPILEGKEREALSRNSSEYVDIECIFSVMPIGLTGAPFKSYRTISKKPTHRSAFELATKR